MSKATNSILRLNDNFMIKDNVDPTLDFKKYSDPEDMVGYLGFIDPLGNFYRDREIGDPESNIPHNTWARHFLNCHGLEREKDMTDSLTLVKNYGFILCSYRTDLYSGEKRTYIIPDVDCVLDALKCEVLLNNQLQLKTIQSISYYESDIKQNTKKLK